LHAGNCSTISSRYLDAYAGMCGGGGDSGGGGGGGGGDGGGGGGGGDGRSGGLAYSLDTLWGCAVFLALLYPVYLPMIMWALKIAHQVGEERMWGIMWAILAHVS